MASHKGHPLPKQLAVITFETFITTVNSLGGRNGAGSLTLTRSGAPQFSQPASLSLLFASPSPSLDGPRDLDLRQGLDDRRVDWDLVGFWIFSRTTSRGSALDALHLADPF